MDTMPRCTSDVTLGVDTHEDTHAAALADPVGRIIAGAVFASDPAGGEALIRWGRKHGNIVLAGVEGTGSYGAGLAQLLAGHNIPVVEVTRASRRERRHLGKTDLRDAEGAALAALRGDGVPVKTHDGVVEAIRTLRLTRASAVKARGQATQQLGALIITAPAPLRADLEKLRDRDQILRCARIRRRTGLVHFDALLIALRTLATRIIRLADEITSLDKQLRKLVQATAPRMLAQPGVGPECAARLLVVAGDNPDRLASDAALAALCGSSPVEASSGKTRRHRLNCGGDRTGNSALWIIANNRMMHHPETRAYVTRRTAQGLSRAEIRRCLMRHLARRLYPFLVADLTDARRLRTTIDLT